MVTIIHGEINSGKTTQLLQNYQKTLMGDGFLSLKTMVGKQVKCYDALELSTGKQLKLAYHENYRPEAFKGELVLGPYTFDEQVFLYMNQHIEECLQNKVAPIYLDEIGNLELLSHGFASILKKLVDCNTNCIISVRTDLVDKIIKKMGITEYKQIPVIRNEINRNEINRNEINRNEINRNEINRNE